MAAIMMMGIFFSPAYAATATYTYDNLNRLTRVSYDNGKSINYTYDAAGNITRVDKISDSATVDAPTAITLEADNIASGAATLHGSVNANNAEAVVIFQYGTTTAYSLSVDAEPGLVDGAYDTSVSASLSDMAPSTTYHFRIIATNSEGTSYGEDRTFTTLPMNNAMDQDQDTVLDEWEIENYGNTIPGRDDYANMDTDGDGYFDLEEYLNGTDISIPNKFIDAHLCLMGNVSYTLEAGTYTQVSGTAGTNNIVIESGAEADCLELGGNNTITLASESGLFTVFRSGLTVTLHGTDDTTIALSAASSPQTIIFSDGAADLIIEQGIVKLGNQVIASYPDNVYTTLEATPEIIENSSASLENPDAYLILNSDASYTLKRGSNTAIYGSSGTNNIYLKSGAAARLYSLQGSNTITIEAESKFFMVSRSGATVTLEGNEGTTLILPATSTPQSIVFSDGEKSLIIDSNQVLLGDQLVTTTADSIDVGAEGIGECGAYIAPGVWKEFDCYNLAAIGKTTGDDPFTPSWRLIGGYWQWGRKGPDSSQWYDTNTSNFAHGPTGPDADEANDGKISGWDDSYASDGAWSDSAKTANDPCPTGYKVPSKTQWEGVMENNTRRVVGTSSISATN